MDMRDVESNEKLYGFLSNGGFSPEINLKLIKRQIEKNGETIIVIEGKSMVPFLRSGDRVKITKLHKLSVGLVILFYTTDIFNKINIVLHRVIKIEGQKIWTKGDNNSRIDEYIHVENVLGEFSGIV